jgi:hypothetical protein
MGGILPDGDMKEMSEETTEPGLNATEPTVEPTEPAVEEPELTLAQMTAELVRERTNTEAKLTPVAALAYEGEMLDEARREELIAEIQADESCSDIEVVRTSKGDVFLYSKATMSGTFARILLRKEDGNPYATIVDTVREESETYPRPTTINLFKDPIFGIDSGQLEQLVKEIVQLPEYGDIKLIEASTGVLYLYSDRHLDKDWAESLVEWEEVGRFKSL